MADNMPEVKEEKKIQTKYDRKMEARRKQKEQDIKEEKRDKIFGILVAVAAIAIVATVIFVPIVRKNSALKDTYAKIAGHDVTKVEYDYYYTSVVSNYVSQYGSILPYMGLDVSLPFENQVYLDEMTWKDYFDQATVDQIMRIKVLCDEARASATAFVYDTDAEYETFKANVAESAKTSGVTVKQYYQQLCGAYATEENMEPFIKEGLLADAYYQEMLKQYTPTEEEVTAYYEENKQSYDQVDYRSFVFTTELAEDATDEQVKAAMDELSVKAEAMKSDLEAGGNFEELCIANAEEDAKAAYEDEATELCLTEGGYYMSVAGALGDWLYDEARTEGELGVVYDEAARRYYVVEFLQKYYDEENNTGISNMIAEQDLAAYLNEKLAACEVVDVKGKLKYLTLEDTTTETTVAE